MKKCLLDFCEREATSRGLCNTHYNWVRERVARGQYSWEELESLGMVQPPRVDVQSEMKKKFDALVSERLKKLGE